MKNRNDNETRDPRDLDFQDEPKVVYLKDSRLKRALMIICTLCAVVSTVFIILIYFCICRNNERSTENASLRERISLLEDVNNSWKKEIDLIKAHDSIQDARLDSLEKRVAILEDCCCKKHNAVNNTVRKLQSENINLRKQINVLRDSLKLKEIPIPSIEIIPTDSVTEKVSVRELKLQIVKTSFYKESSEQKVLDDYFAPLTFSSLSGFSKDSLYHNYPYLNENLDSSYFAFNSQIFAEKVSLNIYQNKKTMFSENKVFSLSEVGGLQAYKDSGLMNLQWTSQRFLERTFDPKRFNRGKWECIVGPIIAGAGGFGVGYYAFNPMVEVNVYKGDKLVGTDKTYNVPMIITSGAVFLAGVGITLKGCLDKKLSYKVTPTELSLIYKINSK